MRTESPGRPWWILRGGLLLAGAGLVLAGCAATGRGRPSVGAEATIAGRSYQEVWQAALEAARARSTLVEQDQSLGIIRADGRREEGSPSEPFHILVSPPVAGAATYRVEVLSGQPGRGRAWARQVIRHIRDLLQAESPSAGERGRRPLP